MYVIARGQMDQVGRPVPVEVTLKPVAALDTVSRPGLEESHGEGAVTVGEPGMSVVTCRKVDEVIFAVVVEVAHAPGATLDSVSRPGLEVAYGECSVTVRQPGMDVVARG